MEYINILVAVFLGIWIASYTSSVFFRLPRNIPLTGIGESGKKPFCSKCHHPLKFYEYYSVLSWIFCGNKCNYCGEKISSIYRISEAIVIFSSAAIVYFTGFDEHYFLLLALAIELIITTSIIFSNLNIPNNMFLVQGGTQIIILTYLHNQLTDWLIPVSLSLYFPLILQKLKIVKLDEEYNKILILTLISTAGFGIHIFIFALIFAFLFSSLASIIFKRYKLRVNKLILNLTNFIIVILGTNQLLLQ